MVPYRYDPEHIAPANAAPRCQHIKLSGQHCGAPARRRRRFCHFHEHILRPKNANISIGFIEDAASLQWAIMQVLRLIHSPNPDYKACGLSLYALQIAQMNLKRFVAEQPNMELSECEQAQRKIRGDDTEDDFDEDDDDSYGCPADRVVARLRKKAAASARQTVTEDAAEGKAGPSTRAPAPAVAGLVAPRSG